MAAITNQVKKKIWKPLVAIVVLFAAIVGILANWEAAERGLRYILGKF